MLNAYFIYNYESKNKLEIIILDFTSIWLLEIDPYFKIYISRFTFIKKASSKRNIYSKP